MTQFTSHVPLSVQEPSYGCKGKDVNVVERICVADVLDTHNDGCLQINIMTCVCECSFIAADVVVYACSYTYNIWLQDSFFQFRYYVDVEVGTINPSRASIAIASDAMDTQNDDCLKATDLSIKTLNMVHIEVVTSSPVEKGHESEMEPDKGETSFKGMKQKAINRKHKGYPLLLYLTAKVKRMEQRLLNLQQELETQERHAASQPVTVSPEHVQERHDTSQPVTVSPGHLHLQQIKCPINGCSKFTMFSRRWLKMFIQI